LGPARDATAGPVPVRCSISAVHNERDRVDGRACPPAPILRSGNGRHRVATDPRPPNGERLEARSPQIPTYPVVARLVQLLRHYRLSVRDHRREKYAAPYPLA